jgi:hypothetical protein
MNFVPASFAFCIAFGASAHAAAPPASVAPGEAVVAPIAVATGCLNDVRAFSGQMQNRGYWLGGSAYGYGYPIGDYGYPMAGYPANSDMGYQNTRPGYEVRNLLASANILAQNGHQQACEDVLAATRTISATYTSDLHHRGWGMADGSKWQKQQIAAAVPITEKMLFHPGQLMDTEIRNTQDEGLGSVHNIILNPTTGKTAYLIIGRGGIFGIDEKFVPVPFFDFKLTQNINMLVLDAIKATMDAAPQFTNAQFTANGQFAARSQQVDTYWTGHIPAKVSK